MKLTQPSTRCPSIQSEGSFLVSIHGKTSIVIRVYFSTGEIFFLLTWEPNLWSNSEVEITEKVRELLSVSVSWNDMDRARNTQDGNGTWGFAIAWSRSADQRQGPAVWGPPWTMCAAEGRVDVSSGQVIISNRGFTLSESYMLHSTSIIYKGCSM